MRPLAESRIRDAHALAAFAALGWRGAVAETAGIVARGGLYALVLAIFWQLWLATPLSELHGSDLTPARLLWYIAVTEWVVFASGLPYREIEADVRDGALAVALTRPVAYAAATFAQWLGGAAYRLMALGAIGFAVAWALTGTVAIAAASWPGIALAGVLGIVLVLLCQLAIGLAAVWVGAAAPLFWIWQKLLFVLGGMLIPLTLYPEPLRWVARASPFAAMLFVPGSLALDADARLLPLIAEQLLWLAGLALVVVAVERAAVARLVARGA
jgi:ABC-2 type transport system permease protein